MRFYRRLCNYFNTHIFSASSSVCHVLANVFEANEAIMCVSYASNNTLNSIISKYKLLFFFALNICIHLIKIHYINLWWAIALRVGFCVWVFLRQVTYSKFLMIVYFNPLCYQATNNSLYNIFPLWIASFFVVMKAKYIKTNKRTAWSNDMCWVIIILACAISKTSIREMSQTIKMVTRG